MDFLKFLGVIWMVTLLFQAGPVALVGFLLFAVFILAPLWLAASWGASALIQGGKAILKD